MTADATIAATFALAAALSAPAAVAAEAAEQRYIQAVHAAVTANWLRPASDLPGLRCLVEIEQMPGGDVVQVSFGKPCNADAASRDAMQRAVKGASPLPYAGFESVFRPRIRLVFQYDGH
jgi:colicin import membrane protein